MELEMVIHNTGDYLMWTTQQNDYIDGLDCPRNVHISLS